MALPVMPTRLLAAALVAGTSVLAAGTGAPPSAGTGPGASDPATTPAATPSTRPTTPADVQAEHRRQRQLCAGLQVAAVRAECLRQADRTRAAALATLAAPATAGPAAPARPASGALARPASGL